MTFTYDVAINLEHETNYSEQQHSTDALRIACVDVFQHFAVGQVYWNDKSRKY